MKNLIILMLAIATCLLSSSVFAKKPSNNYTFDADVTPDVIFGSGNANGSFTVIRNNGVELGLRIKQRFPTPSGTYNSNGDGTYTFPAMHACPGFGFAPYPLCLATPVWNFEWSINTDYEGFTDAVLSDFSYELGMDANPGKPADFTVFDPIAVSLVAPGFDHAIGDNSGFFSDDPATYASNIGFYNVAQNSWNYEFFNNLGTSLAFFDPSVPGTYDIYLRARSMISNAEVATVSVRVIVE